jgi:hypothetical protein
MAPALPLSWLRARVERISWLDIRLVLAIFLVLGLVYSLVTPIMEALDEVWHFAVIHHISHQGQLPVQPSDPAETGLWRQQGSQPPLYYLTGALLTAWIDTTDFPGLVVYNPHASGGHPEVEGNKNILLHDPQAEAFPYRGTALAIHLLRLYSLALGALTVYGVYRIGLHIVPSRPHLAGFAAALVAFNPQFLFIHGGVINDTLAIALSTWVIERLIWLSGQPLSLRRLPRWALVGGGIGLAMLSKLSAGFLLPLVTLLIIYLSWRQRDWRWGVTALALVGAVALLVSGWWFFRNWRLYGEPTGLSRFIPVAGARPGQFGIHDYLAELGGLELSFWGVFGWFSILADPPVYVFFQTLDRLALAGGLYGLWQLARERIRVPRLALERLGLLACWLLILGVALYRWTRDVMGTQGRLMFPGVASVGVGLAVGLGCLLPRRWRYTGFVSISAILLAISVVAPFRYIASAYRRPPVIAQASLVPERIHVRYGDWAELVGYDITQRSLDPGEPLSLTLYWRALRSVNRNYHLYIHLRGPDGAVLGQLDTYPGWGMYPTRIWEPGPIIADHYRIPIEVRPKEPIVGRIEVGFTAGGGSLPEVSRDPQGREITPIIGRFKINSPASKAPAVADGPNFRGPQGGTIALADWRLIGGQGEIRSLVPGETLPLTLEWVPLARPAADYRVFVHLVGSDLQPLAQSDGEPQSGNYPTSWWEPGERIEETRLLSVPETLPAGSYRLLVGLYHPEFGRLRCQADCKENTDAYQLPIVLRVGPGD